MLSIFSWEQGDTHIRTLCEYNLPALAFPTDGFSDDKGWLKAWQAAFDVEAVTDKFFADYQRVFAQVEGTIEGIPESDGVREIDALVYQLYGLTDAEIELIKQTYRDAGMEM